MLDLVIENGLLVTPRGLQPLDLGIADGRVVGWFVRGRAPEAAETIDAGELWVLPGIVDAHFHCHAPAHPEREDFQSGTRAAAAGGVTTIFEMPITTPAATTGAVNRSRRELGEREAYVDEDAAVSMLLVLVEATRARVHVAHASTRGIVEQARAARRRGLEVSMETCPHYLVCSEDDFERVGPYGKLNPPLRAAEHVAALWEGLADGTIDVVASHHSPYTVDEKEPGWTDIRKVGAGHPGIEFLGPPLLADVQDGRITLERGLRVLTEGPARLGALYPRKGALDPGCDAEVVLFCKSRQLARLFAGWTIRGRVVRTLVRGMTVYERAQIVGRPGHGQQVWPRESAVGTPP